jgi:hypothetical protein
VNAAIDVATNQKTMVMGLSIQDYNLQTVFSKAEQVNPWPWPCAPHAPTIFAKSLRDRVRRSTL